MMSVIYFDDIKYLFFFFFFGMPYSLLLYIKHNYPPPHNLNYVQIINQLIKLVKKTFSLTRNFFFSFPTWDSNTSSANKEKPQYSSQK